MPELRRDPITRGWVIIAPERQKRPADFFTSRPKDSDTPCPFCKNPSGDPLVALESLSSPSSSMENWTVSVIHDKYPLLETSDNPDSYGDGMYDLMGGYGHHELVIESTEHGHCLENMSNGHIRAIFQMYQKRLIQMQKDANVSHVLITRNTGHFAGANIHHPHSHIVGLPIVPKKVHEELEGARLYYEYRERCIFCDIIEQEIKEEGRVVLEDEYFLAFCPYASRFPFEVTIIPKVHQGGFETINRDETAALAKTVKKIFSAINSLLGKPPLNYIIHSAPVL